VTTQPATDWTLRAQRLAELLATQGDVHHPAWRSAVAAVPRHIFVPAAYRQDDTGTWQPVDVTSPNGLGLVYSPTTLVTMLADRGTHQESVSSSTEPALMLRMLEALDIHDGHKVLEIGTGTGYNGSWAVVSLTSDQDHYDVIEGGPAALWDTIERAHRVWREHNQPDWTRLGLTITPERQRLWIDTPDGTSWPLPT
jgi:Protein-L-isoaspartate(D-aspartate) O-methyltransferase (PCMT)